MVCPTSYGDVEHDEVVVVAGASVVEHDQAVVVAGAGVEEDDDAGCWQLNMDVITPDVGRRKSG